VLHRLEKRRWPSMKPGLHRANDVRCICSLMEPWTGVALAGLVSHACLESPPFSRVHDLTRDRPPTLARFVLADTLIDDLPQQP